MGPERGGGAAGASVLGFIAAVLGALLCFIGCAASGSALGRPHKVSTALLILLTVGFGIAAVALVRVAIHLEHRWNSDPRTARPAPPPTRSASGPRNGPMSRILATVAVLGVVAFIAAVAIGLHSKAARSSQTQHGGLARSGTVTSAYSQRHYARYSTWTTYDYGVALTAPAGSATSTIAHDPTKDYQDYLVGAPIRVVINPHHLDYAELPGRPFEPSTYYIGPLILIGALLVVAASLAIEEIKHRRLRRDGSQ